MENTNSAARGKLYKNGGSVSNTNIAPTITEIASYLIDFRRHCWIHFTVLNHNKGSILATLDKGPHLFLWISLKSGTKLN